MYKIENQIYFITFCYLDTFFDHNRQVWAMSNQLLVCTSLSRRDFSLSILSTFIKVTFIRYIQEKRTMGKFEIDNMKRNLEKEELETWNGSAGSPRDGARWQGNKRRAGRVFAGSSVFFEISWRRAAILLDRLEVSFGPSHPCLPFSTSPRNFDNSIVVSVRASHRARGSTKRERSERNVETWPIAMRFREQVAPQSDEHSRVNFSFSLQFLFQRGISRHFSQEWDFCTSI